MKLLETTNYLLLIDEENRGIEYGEVGVNMRHSKLEVETRNMGGYGSDKYYWEHKKCIAYYPLNSEAKELDLPLLPNPFDPLERKKFIYLVKNTKAGNEGNLTIDVIRFEDFEEAQDWCKGNSHLEIEPQEIVISQSKQFSLEDMKDALNQLADKAEYGISNFAREDIITKIIQSLSTQQLPKEFIPKYEKVHRKNSDGEDIGFPVHDSDELKTITNSEGKETLVGTWKY